MRLVKPWQSQVRLCGILCCHSCTFTQPLGSFSNSILSCCSPELAALSDAVDAVPLGAEMPAADRGHVGPDAVRNLKIIFLSYISTAIDIHCAHIRRLMTDRKSFKTVNVFMLEYKSSQTDTMKEDSSDQDQGINALTSSLVLILVIL